MPVIGFLSTSPVIEDSMVEEVARAVEALDDHDVQYEVGPMGTTIEAPDTATLFDAARAAHDSIESDRVSTVLKIDDERTDGRGAEAKVEAVAEQLGRPAVSSDD